MKGIRGFGNRRCTLGSDLLFVEEAQILIEQKFQWNEGEGSF